MRQLEISARARREIDHILARSRERHGEAAAERYRALLLHAFELLSDEPDRPGTRKATERGLRIYSLRHAARSMSVALRVQSPVHAIAYRFGPTSIRIMRVLHEAMDLPKRLSRGR